MNYTKAHIVTLAAGICFAQGYLKAVEQPRPNKFKVAVAAIALVSVAGNVAIDPMPVDALLRAGNSFAAGATTCGFLTIGNAAGAYAGSYVTHGDTTKQDLGVAVGSGMGAGLAFTPVVASDIAGEFISDKRTTLEHVAGTVGCYCGGRMGIAAVHAALSQ